MHYVESDNHTLLIILSLNDIEEKHGFKACYGAPIKGVLGPILTSKYSFKSVFTMLKVL